MSAPAGELELRAALAADPHAAAPAVALAELLIGLGRAEEALAVTAIGAQSPVADLTLLTMRGTALKALGRLDEAIATYRRAVEAAPRSGVAEHNLAGALGDAHRFADSEAATRRAFAKGLDAPETWLVHGRALMGQARFEPAAEAFREAIRRRPTYADAHGDLAQMIWMQSENAGAACAGLDAAILANPAANSLRVTKARLLENMCDVDTAFAALVPALSARPDDPDLNITASQLLIHRDPAAALDHAERAFAALPDDIPATAALCVANLAAGRAEVAARIAVGLRERSPLDQQVIGLLATAWRLLGDPRYGELYDYARLVNVAPIDTPQGWTSLDAYLADLQRSLERLHPLRGHPVGQSLRYGSQTLQELERLDDPVVRAFFPAVDGPIRRYLASLGSGNDPLRRRATGSYRFNGVWSSRLRASGYHTDHLHSNGWISSACYIALPGAVEHGQQGWIKFGAPGVPTAPPLPAEHYVKPSPGLLVLFPSYMWHGTVPFTSDETRLSIAFDLLPG